MTKDNSVLGIGVMVCLGSALFSGNGVFSMIGLLIALFAGVPMLFSMISSTSNLSGAGEWLVTIGLICLVFILFIILL